MPRLGLLCQRALGKRSASLLALRMIFIRWLVPLMLLVSVGFFAASVVTSELRHRRTGLLVLKWTVVAALVFFAVLAVDRLRDGV